MQAVERYCKVTHKQSTLQSYVSEFVPSLYKRHVKASEFVPMTKHTVSFVFTSYMTTRKPMTNDHTRNACRLDNMQSRSTHATAGTMTTAEACKRLESVPMTNDHGKALFRSTS